MRREISALKAGSELGAFGSLVKCLCAPTCASTHVPVPGRDRLVPCLPRDGQSSASASEPASGPGRSRQTRERSPLFARRCHPPTLLGKHLQEKCLSAKAAALLKPAMSAAGAAGGGCGALTARWSSTPASPAPAQTRARLPEPAGQGSAHRGFCRDHCWRQGAVCVMPRSGPQQD